MNFYDEVMKAERQRTLNYGADIPEEAEIECPVCGSTFAPPTCGAVGHTEPGTCPVCGKKGKHMIYWGVAY